MGTITCRNADAPVLPECSVANVTASVIDDTATFKFDTTSNGILVESLGSICYRVAGTTTWLETASVFNGAVNGTPGQHQVNLSNLADGTYEYTAKGNVNGILCQSPIATFVVDDDDVIVNPPEDCEFCQDGPVLVMEAEDAELAGSWAVSQVEAGFSGSGHLVFNQPSLSINGGAHNLDGGDGSQIAKFNINVKTPGNYKLKLRASALFDEAGDKNNDVWVSHTGTNVSGQLPTANDLEKVYLGGISPSQTWAWTSTVDPTPPAADGDYWMNLSAGSHCITLTGRSGQFYIDRVALCLNGEGNPDNVASVACTGGTVNPPGPDEIDLTPDNKPSATGRYKPCDLISLHYDAAPDPDDLHAMAAGNCVLSCYGIKNSDRFCVALGAHGLRAATNGVPIGGTRWGNFIAGSPAVADAAFGNNNWSLVRGPQDNGNFFNIGVFASKWKATIDTGCDVWVAEGGPSDFTAQVGQFMQNNLGCTAAELKRIHVVQHSHSAGWNEQNTLPANINWISANLDYIKIDNGNLSPNNTADFRSNQATNDFQGDLGNFWNKVKASGCGAGWAAAEGAFGGSNTIDFSDTVELLYILNVSQGANGTVKDISDFCDIYAS